MVLQKAIFDVLYPGPLIQSTPNQYSHIYRVYGHVCGLYGWVFRAEKSVYLGLILRFC